MLRKAGGNVLKAALRGGLASSASVQQTAAGGASGTALRLAATQANEGAEAAAQARHRWGETLGVAAAATAAGVAVLAGPAVFADEAEHGLESPPYAWSHAGLWDSYDVAAIRRGHQVYQQVCAACHSMEYIHWRDLVGVAYTEEEAKALAQDVEVEDGPNDQGENYFRPGRLSDPLPKPYKNEEHARYANGGAYPPDLSLITKARHDGQNYVFSLLLGYREPPEGISIREGLYYNPYFPGGAIAMPKMLNDEGVEYDDGTPATESQQAKDVTTFLQWAAEPEQDERKLMGIKWMVAFSVALVTAVYYRRWMWAPIKTQKVVLDVVR
ncbi:unnamed protein product [Pedinophyceae sp. YPF-701]|nr:unnamed protein product [Pedinophyceae sp. YPF-701]